MTDSDNTLFTHETIINFLQSNKFSFRINRALLYGLGTDSYAVFVILCSFNPSHPSIATIVKISRLSERNVKYKIKILTKELKLFSYIRGNSRNLCNTYTRNYKNIAEFVFKHDAEVRSVISNSDSIDAPDAPQLVHQMHQLKPLTSAPDALVHTMHQLEHPTSAPDAPQLVHQMHTKVQDRKYKIEEEEVSVADAYIIKKPKPIADEIKQAWNNACSNNPKTLPPIRSMTVNRLKSIAKLTEIGLETIQDWNEYICMVFSSKYLTGQIKQWSADFDWVIEKDHAIKILEGKYNDKKSRPNDFDVGKNDLIDELFKPNGANIFAGRF